MLKSLQLDEKLLKYCVNSKQIENGVVEVIEKEKGGKF